LDDSPIWADLIKIKEVYWAGRGIVINNGAKVSFWEDPWLFEQPLCVITPELFTLSEQKHVYVRDVKNGNIQLTFRRWLSNDLRTIWSKIWELVELFQLNEQDDIIKWKWENKGKFTVRSTYNKLTTNDNGPHLKSIWKGKIPPKIKYFMWLLTNGVVLTKDNLLRKNWKGSPDCYFCNEDETIDHLFFHCSVARVVWACCWMPWS